MEIHNISAASLDLMRFDGSMIDTGLSMGHAAKLLLGGNIMCANTKKTGTYLLHMMLQRLVGSVVTQTGCGVCG